MKDTILFDLGNTLVQYYERSEYPVILEEALAEVWVFLDERGLLSTSREAVRQRAQEENYEFENYRVRPLEERLARIFQLDDPNGRGDLKVDMCRRFLRPIFARGQPYEDTLPTLRQLESEGFTMAIVTNTPWGTPADLWRDEITRLGLGDHVDAVVCCTDVGWRKPARQIFDFTVEKLQASPQGCVFVGDHPQWDVAGARAVGMEAIHIDRRGTTRVTEEESIHNLSQLRDRLRGLGLRKKETSL